ncbi:hypothetical protein [Thalassotalea sp. ND16A]|uniref:hypothetical protein n=1 Tax=Thalassotalea sp. ND16A TaxID=1535422 RepID=UPI00051A89B1|nr:hypothetical protein [Thalassotalea sp. ND16A]KGJ88767.1 hypothetical protein ND16A_2469 [Thalassotalea sp. ND16A]
MTKALAVYAGPSALAQIKEQGISQEQIKMMVGASGGPKWFVLAGLDRYFCGEFFKSRTSTLYTLGSSAGAWRFACYAQQNPLAAINRLIHAYSHLSYPLNADKDQVTRASEQMLADVLASRGAVEIATNPLIKSNIIVAKSTGLTRYEHKALQIPGLIASAAGNRLQRKKLGNYYQRVIFTSDNSYIPFDYDDGIRSKVVSLTKHNTEQALQATGSIPLIINGVRDIKGAGKGMYRDGGIIDYHFDQRFLPGSNASQAQQEIKDDQQGGLVLYPHFYNEFKPGWFDKYIKHRFANKQHFDNTVVLAPTAEFVNKLPFGKIPDRKDFTQLTEAERIKYWQSVIDESERLAEEFDQLIGNENAAQIIKPI